MYYLGIDPGKSGAWAILDENEKIVAADLFTDLSSVKRVILDMRLFCALEKVHAMPRQGVVSSFTFAENYGAWQGFLQALGIPFILIAPERWQNDVLDFKPAPEKKPKDEDIKNGRDRLARNRKILKEGIVNFVRRRIPEASSVIKLKKHYDIADALCLALYAKKKHGQSTSIPPIHEASRGECPGEICLQGRNPDLD
jgi:hypothetical protein